MPHYHQMPLPLSSLFLLYQETRERVMSLNKAVPEQHFTHLDTILDNVVQIDIAELPQAERSLLQIRPSYAFDVTWVTKIPDKDWEIMWKWKPPLGAAQFTLYARGLGPQALPERPLMARTQIGWNPNCGRSLVRMCYQLQDLHVTPDNWIERLDRDAKPSQWRDVIRFVGLLGRLEFWNPIVRSLEEGQQCIPLRTAQQSPPLSKEVQMENR